MEIEELDAAIKAIERITTELNPSVAAVHQNPTLTVAVGKNGSDVYRKMTLKDAAVHLLATHGPSKTTSEIVEGLWAGGVRSKSQNPYTTLYNTLTEEAKRENGKIIRNEDKSWSLRVVDQPS
jgi:hypothetical protein